MYRSRIGLPGVTKKNSDNDQPNTLALDPIFAPDAQGRQNDNSTQSPEIQTSRDTLPHAL